ncbi:MAG: hypothetical protein ABFQ82_03940 [Thermodesulfobacteriota bacterium]
MLDKSSVIRVVLERLKKLPAGHYLDLRTYKRDRSVLIVKRGDEDILVVEDGFYKDSFAVDIAKLKSLLRTLLKKEFPRSNKVRLYTMAEYSPDGAARIKRKKI